MNDLNKNKKLARLKTPPKNGNTNTPSPDFDGHFVAQASIMSDSEEDDLDSPDTTDDEADSTSQNSEKEPNTAVAEVGYKKEDKKEQSKESKSSDHDGKYFVIQKGMCKCNQGFNFPKFKVTSHQKHYWNDAEGEADYLAVTEDDLMLDPPVMPFGKCKLKPSSGGYLPCSYAPIGKWQKPYEKVNVMGHSCLTEISELQCAIGGKITILKHGQQSEAGKSNVKKADAREQQTYNPFVDFEEFQEDVNPDETVDYE